MKIDITVNANIHLHLPPVVSDEGVEEILEAVAILSKDIRMSTAALTRLVASASALATQVAATNTEIEEVVSILREADDSTDLNAVADKLDGLLQSSASAASDAQDAIDAHNASTATGGTGGTDTITGGQGTDPVNTTTGGQGTDPVSIGTGDDQVGAGNAATPEGAEQA